MTSTNDIFNPELFSLARRSKGMSQSSLHRETLISQSFLSKVERGETTPSFDNVKKIAKALGVPSNFFFQQIELPGGPISFEAHFRKKASVRDTKIDELKAKMQIELLAVTKILSLVKRRSKYTLPQFRLGSSTPEEAARIVRQKWGIPHGPLPNLVKLVEDSGIVLMPFKPLAEIDGVDGVTIFGDDGEIFIFLNTRLPADRQRFTLAHELGHALLHRIPSHDMEQQANDFAAELLLPEKDMLNLFREQPLIDLNTLAALKPTWQVAIQMLLVRVKKLGLVSNERSTSMWKQISALRWRLREPPELDFEREKIRAFKKVCLDAQTHFDGVTKRLADYLCMDEAEVLKMTEA